MMQITATPQDTRPPRISVTVDGAPVTGSVSVFRVEGNEQTLVRGMVDRDTSSGAIVSVDIEQPLNEEFSYRAVHTSDLGVLTEDTTGTLVTEAALPWLVDPINSVGIEIEIQSWSTLSRRGRQRVIDIPGAVFPAVMSDRRVAASSSIVFMVRSEETLLGLRSMLDGARRLLLRPVGGAVEAAYLSFGDSDEERLKPSDPRSWLRLVSADVQQVAAPPASIASVGDTLMDLHEYVGGEDTTLATLNTTFGPGSTLLDIAQTQLLAGG